MSLEQKVVQFLKSQKVKFDVINTAPFSSPIQAAHHLRVDPKNCAQTILLQDRFGLVLAVLPATYVIDFNTLKQVFKRHFIRVSEQGLQEIFGDCFTALLPPLGDVFSLRTLIDQSVVDSDTILFPMGDDTHLIRMRTDDYEAVTSRAWHGGSFAHQVEVSNEKDRDIEHQPVMDIRRQIEAIEELPPLPQTAQHILALSHRTDARVKDLAEVVELDASLAAQVVRYANSPFFNYRGSVFTVHDAIARVLGFDNVMNLALGIATAKPFRIPKQGSLGLAQYWRNATYTAALAQALCKIMPLEKRIKPGLSYLCGLLHNFGYLVLGHSFSKAYFLLNKLVESDPQADIIELENRSLGVHHGELGLWLLESWELPPEVLAVVKSHHDENYVGQYASYVQLILVVDRLVGGMGIGAQGDAELPQASLNLLGISESACVDVMNDVLDGCDGLNTMARQLVA